MEFQGSWQDIADDVFALGHLNRLLASALWMDQDSFANMERRKAICNGDRR